MFHKMSTIGLLVGKPVCSVLFIWLTLDCLKKKKDMFVCENATAGGSLVIFTSPRIKYRN